MDHFWSNTANTSKSKQFDAAEEIKKVVLDYASHENTAAMTAVTAELVNIFDSQTIASSKTNLMRTFLWYNYGAWMDNDMVLVQSVAPLLGDWNGSAKASSMKQRSQLQGLGRHLGLSENVGLIFPMK